MGPRPLRQYYDGVRVDVDPDLGTGAAAWVRHRRRFAASLAQLTEEQWHAPTRCESWDARGVVGHLVAVDGFWALTLGAAQARREPTTFIRGFNPSNGTDDLVAPLLELPTEALLEQFVAGTDTLVAVVESFTADDWDAVAEAPFGHVPARLILGHALWDSWLHERDIFEPLGMSTPIQPDEVVVATWYSLVTGGLQGGLIDDAAPVGPCLDQPIDVALRFDDLAAYPLHVRIDSGVRITRVDVPDAVAAGSAVAVVEGLTGREPLSALDALPDDLAGQLARAGQIL